MGRAPCCEKVGLKRGRWTTEEDEILMKYIEANGEGSWRSLPKNAGLLRCGKSCRLRWINYLRTDVKRGNITSEEEDTIVKLHTSLGNRWSLIAAHLPGRTDNEIKNYWNSRLSRRIHCFRRRHGNENLPPILMDLTKFGSSGGFKQRKGGRTARHAMKKKSIYKIDATVAAMTSVEKKTVKSVADSEIGVDNPSCEAAGGQGVETELMGVNGGIMGEEEALDTDGILINFDEVMVAVDQQRERHDEELELGWNKETNEEMDEQDWADWDWNAIAAAASSGGGGVAVAADDIHSSSSGTGMLAQDGEEILSWLWEDDDDGLERAGTTSVEDCEQQQQALAAWLLS